MQRRHTRPRSVFQATRPSRVTYRLPLMSPCPAKNVLELDFGISFYNPGRRTIEFPVRRHTNYFVLWQHLRTSVSKYLSFYSSCHSGPDRSAPAFCNDHSIFAVQTKHKGKTHGRWNSQMKTLDPLCFRIEAAGPIDNFPRLVIPGVYNHSNSYENEA